MENLILKEPMVKNSNHVQAGVVYQTNDLDKFVTLNGNRIVNTAHVNRLADSISKEGMLMNPILINSLWEVIDGQHRLEAARLACSGVYYIVVNGYGLSEVHTLNLNQKNWIRKDYLEGYADMNIESYVKLKEFMKHNEDFSISICISLCSNMRHDNIKSKERKSTATEVFEEGTWKGGDFELAQEWADKIRLISKFYEGYNRRAFVSCLVGMFLNDSFDFNEFMNKLRLQPTALVDCSNVTQYKVLIEDIYNYRRRNKINLRY